MASLRAFGIERAKPGGQFRYTIEASHPCGVMGLNCPSCGVWVKVGIHYPSVDATAFGDEITRHMSFRRPRKRPPPLTIEQFAALSKRIAPFLGPNRPIAPGTRFGPLQGWVSGTFGHFAWAAPGTPLVRESVYEKLVDAGFDLLGVPAKIRLRRQPQEPLIELEVRPTAKLHASLRPRTCEVCGRFTTEIEKVVVEAASYDDSIPLQRILEWPVKLVANEALANFIQDQDFAGVTVIPMELSD